MRVFLFWLCFTIVAIWGQYLLPGTDFLAAGLVVSMQEQDRSRTLWLAVPWILLQEGMGNLAFGMMPLLYGSLALAFYFGRWLFEARNILFICLLGFFSGASQAWLALTMAGLQGVAPERGAVLATALLQALLFPLLWLTAQKMYARFVTRHAQRVATT
ncbi:hypothetical protein dsat_0217 [Alkalidesulfovibrio alkalitolerans DSM 16529]|uniref:Rod shape-determining protein MreD n=1 Tax=Alkalidesulfovibrio alkalitolerans DSM 16529 TaxID=1121439 RepID=S7T8A0_9BACT|nr:hypothetical protein [Alkalidesulfovibrio alkalitolerans]EPR32776.1 hypothetical protein dsat_0217 [Alkalidesulfovibrio alkalitolerans DSM 16529]